jgi:hypothetical protein
MKNFNMLEFLESKEFRKSIRETVIEYKEINSHKVVDPEYIARVLESNPMDFSNMLFEKAGIKVVDQISNLSILKLQIDRIVKEEIALLTQDVNFGGKLSDYIRVLGASGFKKISQIDYEVNGKEESEIFYWNKNFSMLVKVESYNKETDGLNSINLMAEGKPRNPNSKETNVLLGNLIPCTDIKIIKTDLREFPLQQIENLIRSFKFEKTWKNIESIDYYSSLSHGKNCVGNKDVWIEKAIEKISTFPMVVQESILKDVCSAFENDVKILESFNLSKDYFKVKKVAETLTEKEKIDILIADSLFDVRYSKNHYMAISEELMEKLIHNKVENPLNFVGIIVAESIKLDIDQKLIRDKAMDKLKALSDKQLRLVRETMRIGMNYFKEKREMYEIVDSYLNIKKNKIKLN